MYTILNDKKYNVEIKRKRGVKKIIARVRDGKVLVTINNYTPTFLVKVFLDKNKDFLAKLAKQYEDSKGFYLLGKKYKVIKSDKFYLTSDTAYVPDNFNYDKFLRDKAKILYKERLDKIWSNYSRKVPYPKIVIRKMTSRWGVNNPSKEKITLNLELMKKDIKYLDYVIVHELAHFIEANHQKVFWDIVEENYPDYKKVRRELNRDNYK